MKQSNPFQAVGTAKVPRSSFDLSHEVKTTQDFGDLVPISCWECVPGDVHQIGLGAVIRAQPLLAPVMHKINLRAYAFFVPYRILFSDWEEFITRGEDGNSVVTLPTFLPQDNATNPHIGVGSLWNYLGFSRAIIPNADSLPLDFPRRAYLKIWNDYFRIPDLQTELEIDPPDDTLMTSFYPAKRNWTRDYFTSALPWQQRGTAPALPVYGSVSGSVAHTGNFFGSAPVNSNWDNGANGPDYMGAMSLHANAATGAAEGPISLLVNNGSTPTSGNFGGDQTATAGVVTNANTFLRNQLNVNALTGTAMLTTSDISDLRLAWQTQVYLERNARGGARYIEQLQVRFGTSPRDERLQRPEYIGGSTSPILVSEVLQQSASDTQPTPLGNLAGHGIGLVSGHLGGYRVQEHGLIMILAEVDPSPAYVAQGIERSWLRRTTWDFYAPEFAGLSEQEIYNAEIYAQEDAGNTGVNRDPFGYTGAYNELRYIPNKITGDFGSTYAYWHLGRKFASLPTLNEDFVKISAAETTELNRIFVAPSEPGWLTNYGIRLTSHRPLPYLAVPSGIGGQG